MCKCQYCNRKEDCRTDSTCHPAAKFMKGKPLDRGNCPMKSLFLRLLRCSFGFCLGSLLRLNRLISLLGLDFFLRHRGSVMTAASVSLGWSVTGKCRKDEKKDSAKEQEASGNDHAETDII